MPCEGLPHSEIPGSKPVCGSPRLIAACHVLHRFSAPRHPPSTLSSLTIKYLRRESFSFTRLSCQRSRSPRIKKPLAWLQGAFSSAPSDQVIEPAACRLPPASERFLLSESFLIRAPSECHRFRPQDVGGAERNRTADLRLAKPPLSQLSYSPT